jgi:Ca2+/Na+ antiporter
MVRTVPPSGRNCSYGGKFRPTVRSLLFFIITILIMFIRKNLTLSSSYTEHVSALILYLVYVFYTLKHGLSEMIEIVTPV